MTSLLYAEPSARFSPANGLSLKRAELEAHDTVMLALGEAYVSLPDDVKHRADAVVCVGAITALARILAETPNQDEAQKLIANLSEIVRLERMHWMNPPRRLLN